jgi:hypothetical protein
VAVRHTRRPPAARQAPAALPALPGRRPPTGPAPARLPGRPRPAVPARHRPEAMLDSDGAPEGRPYHRRDGKEPQHAAPLSLCPSCSQGRNVRRCCVGFGSSQTRVTDGPDGRITRSARALVQEPASAEPPVSCSRPVQTGGRVPADSRGCHGHPFHANRTFGPGPVAASAPLRWRLPHRWCMAPGGMAEGHLMVGDPDRYPNM